MNSDAETGGDAGRSRSTTTAEGDPVVVEGEAADHGGEEAFDWRGWTLVGVVVLCFLVIPATILVRPPALPWEVALLVLPLLPAFLLGAVAVWAALRGD